MIKTQRLIGGYTMKNNNHEVVLAIYNDGVHLLNLTLDKHKDDQLIILRKFSEFPFIKKLIEDIKNET